MKTTSQANNPQQSQAQAQAPQQPQQSQAHQSVSQVVVPTPALDVNVIIQKLTDELTHLSISDVLNSPVLAAAAANPELVKLVKTVIDCNKTAKQVTVTSTENTKEEITLPARYGVLAGMFNLH